MKLSYFLTKECIIIDLAATDKESTLNELIDRLYQNTSIQREKVSKNSAYEAILKRELEESTAIGDGMAFPHARIERLKKSYTLIAVSKNGIDFDSIDKKPVHFFVFSLVSQNQPNVIIKTRAVISKYLETEGVKGLFLNVKSADEIWKVIEKSNVQISYEVTARDIIDPQHDFLEPHVLLKDAAKRLRQCKKDTLPVLNKNSELVGALSYKELFSYQMPDFFFYMKKNMFIKHMDPFKEYFEVEDKISIANVMKSDSLPTVHPDSTLMEVIYEMIVKNKEYLYVVEDKKLIGVITRMTIIEKVLVAV